MWGQVPGLDAGPPFPQLWRLGDLGVDTAGFLGVPSRWLLHGVCSSCIVLTAAPHENTSQTGLGPSSKISSSPIHFFIFIFQFLSLFIYFFGGGREKKQGKGRERGGEDPKQALSYQREV